MQKKLNNEDFILERFPDDVFHEMEKKELKKEGIEQGRKQGIEQGMKKGLKQGITQGIEQEKVDIIKTLLKKNMTPEEIADLLDYDIEKVREVENSCQ